MLLDVLEARIDEALGGGARVSRYRAGRRGRGKEARAGTHVVLVGRGSTDPDGNAEVAKVARLLWEARLRRRSAELHLTDRAVRRLQPWKGAGGWVRSGSWSRRTSCSPTDPGHGPGGRVRGSSNPEIDVRVSGLIGACDELAGLVLERYAEALMATSG